MYARNHIQDKKMAKLNMKNELRMNIIEDATVAQH